MLLTIGSTILMGGVAIYAHQKQTGNFSSSDHEKIQKIFNARNLKIKDGKEVKTIRLITKRKIENGMEYVYQLPLGLSFDQVQEHRSALEDGVNIKTTFSFLNWNEIKNLKINRDIINQIKKLISKEQHNKEVVLEHDGMLKVKVYNTPLPKKLDWNENYLTKGWKIPIGESREDFVYHDFEEVPHMLVGGSTGGGKSSFLDMLICHLLQTQSDNVKLHLIDLKGGVEFSQFENCKQVVNYAEHPEDALEVLEGAYEQIKSLQEKFKEKGVKNVKEAGIKERHFVIVDEIAELASCDELDKEMKKIKKDCEVKLSEIARLGRSQGFRLVTATQHPIQDYVPGSVKRNSDARLCFRVRDAVASRVVLDTVGGEHLPKIVGRAIYQDRGQNNTLQTVYMDSKKMNEVITPNIVIKARKEEKQIEKGNRTTAARGTNTFEFEKTGLS